MNQSHLKFICAELQLGLPTGTVTSIEGSRGGSFIWRVNTDKATYAIKQLAPAIDLKNEKMVAKYELSESIAGRFANEGIPAISAIEKGGKHLHIIDDKGYLAYPWVEGYVLGRNEISEPHALKIAEIIAKLHAINLNVPEMDKPHVDIHTSDSIVEAIDRAASFKCPFSETLKESQNLILSMNERYLAVVAILLENTVVSHGDLDQLNILWDENDQPILIDWESVRKLNPTREIVRTSLGWSGFGMDDASQEIYTHMLRTYIQSGGALKKDHVNAALYAPIGSMVNWIMYNIDLACTSHDPEVAVTTMQEISGTLKSMKRYDQLIPDLLKVTIRISREI